MKRFDYAGKVALITGASMGIGAVFARELSRRGARPVLVARSQQKLETLAATLPGAEVIVADLAEPGAAERVFAEVTRRGLEVDMLVNNAGYGRHGAFEELSLSDQRGEIDLNVTALVELTHVFLPMLERRQGGVLNVASFAAFMPIPYMAVYGATKAFVLSFSEALWAEYRPRGVRVTCLNPGATDTPFFERSGDAASAGAKRVAPEGVVDLGLRAFADGKASVVHGAQNRIGAFLPRLLPRALIARIAALVTRPKAPALSATRDLAP